MFWIGLVFLGWSFLMEEGDDESFSRHNQALFMAIAVVSGCSVIVIRQSLCCDYRVCFSKPPWMSCYVRLISSSRSLGFANSCRRKGSCRCRLLSVTAENFSGHGVLATSLICLSAMKNSLVEQKLAAANDGLDWLIS